MTTLERFRFNLLSSLNQHKTGLHIQPMEYALKYGVDEKHICEMLTTFADQRLISLAKWDNERERPWNEWRSANEMFSFPSEQARVRVGILAMGLAFLEELEAAQKKPIGFRSPAA